MKRILLAIFTLSLVTSVGVSATETAAKTTLSVNSVTENGNTEQSEAPKLAITEGKLTDTQDGCACSYTVKNLESSPLKKFEAYIFVKNEQGRFRCDAAHFSFNKPIQPNESRTLSNKAMGKSCGKDPSVSLLMVGTCDYADGSECDTSSIDTKDSGLNWVE